MSGGQRGRPGRARSRLDRAAAPAAPGTQVSSISVEQLAEKVLGILQRLMPSAELTTLARDARLRTALAADSMDILNFITALHDELGVDVPEKDYARLDTLNDCIEYLTEAITAREAKAPVSGLC